MIVVASCRFRSSNRSGFEPSPRAGRRLRDALSRSIVALGVLVSVGVRADTGVPPFLLQWGTLGSGQGQFDTPSGIATDASGRLYVADRDNNRIQKFAADGSFVATWGTLGGGAGEFDSPRDVAVDAAGNVYVADAQNDRIQKFTSAGGFVLQWGRQSSREATLIVNELSVRRMRP